MSINFSITNITVRYAETDQMGIVHHSHYPVWYEAGRTDFIKKFGISYSKIEEIGILLPLIKLSCNYKEAAKYEDEITIKTSVKELTNTRITFFYEISKNGESNTINYGETEHVWTNTELKPVILKKHSPELFETIKKAAL